MCINTEVFWVNSDAMTWPGLTAWLSAQWAGARWSKVTTNPRLCMKPCIHPSWSIVPFCQAIMTFDLKLTSICLVKCRWSGHFRSGSNSCIYWQQLRKRTVGKCVCVCVAVKAGQVVLFAQVALTPWNRVLSTVGANGLPYHWCWVGGGGACHNTGSFSLPFCHTNTHISFERPGTRDHSHVSNTTKLSHY